MPEHTADPIKSHVEEPDKGDSQKGAGDKMAEHHERIMACEKMLGIHHPSHGAPYEPSEKEKRHASRKKRDEGMAERPRH